MKGSKLSIAVKHLLLTAPLLMPVSFLLAAETSGNVELKPIADQKARTQQEIDALNARIKQAQTNVSALNNLASSLERKLGQAQKALSKNQRERFHVIAAIAQLKTDMLKTNTAIDDAQADLAQHKRWIEEQLREHYKYGQDSGLKLVLSGQSPSDTARLLRYHQQVHATRQVRMGEIRRQQQHLSELKQQQETSQSQLRTQEATLATIERDQTKLKQKLLASQQEAQKSIRQTKNSMDSMEKQTKLLEALLQDLIVQEELTQAQQRGEFAQLKGQLPQPIPGVFQNLYNETQRNGNGRWRGGWIIPPTSARELEVRSVASGHIVYADWLLGYGLLTIIDHGQGFFTLYGHNETLLRAPGDWVVAGTVIALIQGGDSNQAKLMDVSTVKGLYFEIRQNSQALNPVFWLKPN